MPRETMSSRAGINGKQMMLYLSYPPPHPAPQSTQNTKTGWQTTPITIPFAHNQFNTNEDFPLFPRILGGHKWIMDSFIHGAFLAYSRACCCACQYVLATLYLEDG